MEDEGSADEVGSIDDEELPAPAESVALDWISFSEELDVESSEHAPRKVARIDAENSTPKREYGLIITPNKKQPK